MNKKIGVIMSVYKNDNLDQLKEAVESLYNQTYKKFDIFIQNDGEISEKLEKYLDNELHKNRIYFLNKRSKNKGLAYSLNELLKEVFKKNYTYIMRMDADDICRKDRVEKQFDFMEEHTKIDVCGSNIIEFYDDGSEREVKYPTSNDEIRENFSKRTAIPHVTAFFRKSFFDKAGMYNINANRNEDQWLWLNGFLNGCCFASIDKPLVHVRLSLDLLTRRKDIKHLLDTYKLRNTIVHKLGFKHRYYVYNFIILVIKMMPSSILKSIYKYRI